LATHLGGGHRLTWYHITLPPDSMKESLLTKKGSPGAFVTA